MNGTPRLRSAYPTTPQSSAKRGDSRSNGAAEDERARKKLPQVPSSNQSSATQRSPLIPFDIIDGPTQRLYICALFAALNAWRLYDWFKLVQDDSESVWLFLKWTAIDGIALFNIPVLHVPWFEWSFALSTTFFLASAFLNGFLMFRIALPFETWLLAISKVLYDRELSVSERRVKPADILHNSSLILGKQIIHILPEGSAKLNPEDTPFCLENEKSVIEIPIRINQTTPVLIELLRIDLDNNANETITISGKETKKLKAMADKAVSKSDRTSHRVLKFPIKKIGLYRLQRVVDETKLEVRRMMTDTVVVRCPKAVVKPTTVNRCKGELSDLEIEVIGTPPLKIKYSRTVNSKDKGFSFQSILPDGLVSPLVAHGDSTEIVSRKYSDMSWAQPQQITVPVNESLNVAGGWVYSIDEVHDGFGNVANYSRLGDDGDRISVKSFQPEQQYAVYERPVVALANHDEQRPVKIAKGKSTRMPLHFTSTGRGKGQHSYTLSYLFTPIDKLLSNGEHATDAKLEEVTIRDGSPDVRISLPGLYTLQSISTQFCKGQINEPSTFQLINPPEPEISLSAENISDNCAGNAIGLLVDLDLIGTPPFQVRYEVSKKGTREIYRRSAQIDNLRHQLELRPRDAGHYVYTFKSIDDDVYKGHALHGSKFVIEQDVKPPASARFAEMSASKQACIGEPVTFNVRLQGEGPWDLEYEIVHSGKRSKHKVNNIQEEEFTLTTDRLVYGGDYALNLVSIQDRANCKIFLKEEAKIDVRRQRPKASFGMIDGSRAVKTLESRKVNLPLKLSGESPWTVWYRKSDQSPAAEVQSAEVRLSNGFLVVEGDGSYELVDVHDSSCPGSVDSKANKFSVDWIPRPQVKMSESAVVEQSGETWIKKDVCEGDEDAVEVKLTGTPPYCVKYEQKLKPDHGSVSTNNKALTAGLSKASIRMDTSRAGLLEYRFSELGDHLYDHDSQKHSPLVIQQRVHARPTAKFLKPGKTYKYCKDEVSGDEVIPISLQGAPPFYLEIAVKHHAGSRLETIKIPNIESDLFEFRIPDGMLALGNHAVSIRRVRDARGCQRKAGENTPSIQVTVSDIPTISPLETRSDYCVGDRLAFALSGTAPFSVYYTFNGVDRRATSASTDFRRIAETPGNFTLTSISDGASDCRASTSISKYIHEMPSVKVSNGLEAEVDIHEGAEAEIVFDFWGTPPFEFTYTRSSNAQRGQKSQILETRHDISYQFSKSIKASEEGTYEVVAIKDKFCAFSSVRADTKKAQKLLT